MKFHFSRAATLAACGAGLLFLAGQSVAGPKPDSAAAEHARIVAYWTKERVAAAIPRDLRIDERGYGYLRQRDGSLEPYGHTIAALSKPAAQQPMGKPVDTAGPSVTGRDPAAGATISATYTFKATVTDKSASIPSLSRSAPRARSPITPRPPVQAVSTVRKSPASRTARAPGRSSRRTTRPIETRRPPRSTSFTVNTEWRVAAVS